MQDEKQMILGALSAFARQRAGLEFGNYGDVKLYRSEQRSITRDLHDARELIRAVELANGLSADVLKGAFRAFSGRLTLIQRTSDGAHIDGFGVDYCTGQYFPTEYRKAVCAVCASALWDYFREDFAASAKAGESAGSAIRRNFKRMFGPRIANRWFN